MFKTRPICVKLISIIIALLLLLSMIPLTVFASETSESDEVIYQDENFDNQEEQKEEVPEESAEEIENDTVSEEVTDESNDESTAEVENSTSETGEIKDKTTVSSENLRKNDIAKSAEDKKTGIFDHAEVNTSDRHINNVYKSINYIDFIAPDTELNKNYASIYIDGSAIESDYYDIYNDSTVRFNFSEYYGDKYKGTNVTITFDISVSYEDASYDGTYEKTVIIDNEAPKISALTYSPDATKKWINEDCKVSFSVDDPSISSVKYVDVDTKKETTISPTEDNMYSFKVTNYSKEGKYRIVATDYFGNKNDENTTDELYIDKLAPTIIDPGIDYNYKTRSYTFSFKAKDLFENDDKPSGLNMESAKYSIDSSHYVDSGVFSYDEVSGIFKTNELKTPGKFYISISDNAGNVKTYPKTPKYVDTLNPEITSISFEKASNKSSTDKFLNIVSFGLYSNDKIIMSVTAEDPKFSNGFSEDSEDESTIVVSDGQTILSGNLDKPVNNINGSQVTKKYEFPLNKEKPNIIELGKLQVTTTDRDRNSSDPKNISDFNIKLDENEFSINSEFELVASKDSQDFEMTVSGDVQREIDSKDWVTTTNKNTVKVDYSITDNSKTHLHSYSLESKYKETASKEIISKAFTTYGMDKNDEKIDSVEENIDITESLMDDGQYTLLLKAESNNGVKNNSKPKTIYLDNTAPTITEFEFTKESPSKGSKPSPAKDESIDTYNGEPEVMSYGYFFKDQTTVTVGYSDGEGVGVENVQLYKVSLGEDPILVDHVKGTKNSFVIGAGFKGNIYAVATDYLGHMSEETSPTDATIVESEEIHNNTSSVNVRINANPSGKDAGGNDLYNINTVPITLEVKDTYSGIGCVDYFIQGGKNDSHEIEGKETINLSGEPTEDNGWTIEKEEKSNLVVKMTKNINVDIEANGINVELNLTDRAGNKSSSSITFSHDTVSPKISITYLPNEGKSYPGDKNEYYNTDRVANIVVKERNFDPKQFVEKITNTDGKIPGLESVSSWNCIYDRDATDEDEHIAQIRFHDDGDYTFSCNCTDLARNNSSRTEKSFTIDQTKPIVSVSFDNNSPQNGNYYKAARTATINVLEHNFAGDNGYVTYSPSSFGPDNTTAVSGPSLIGWSRSNNNNTATISFSNDGKYSFTFTCKDKAWNQSQTYKCDVFYVDKKIDKLEIVNVKNESAYNKDIAPGINYVDYNLGETQYELSRVSFDNKLLKEIRDIASNLNVSDSGNTGTTRTINYNNFPVQEINDGVYSLSAKLTDKAGNTESKSVLFSVNRYGSTFMLADEASRKLIDNGYTKDAPDVIVKEINVNKVSKQSVSLTYNSSTNELQLGNQYKIASGRNSSASWHQYDYTVFKNNFENDGDYTLTINSVDTFKKKVNNRTANKSGKIERNCPVSFTVDKEGPQIVVSGVEDDVYYKEAEKVITISCEDTNIDKNSFELICDGKTLTKGKDYQIEDGIGSINATYKMVANGSDEDHTIVAKVKDLATNQYVTQVKNFKLAATFFTRFFHNPVAVICTSIGILLVIAAVVFFILKRRSKK